MGPATGTPSSGFPITFFDDVAWIFTDPIERLFFYRHVDPSATFPLPTVIPESIFEAYDSHAAAFVRPRRGTRPPPVTQVDMVSNHTVVAARRRSRTTPLKKAEPAASRAAAAAA
ncbi:anthocyanidin 3-O-glucoside-6''-O-coumaroyltransferase 2-like [Hordeum vulgare]|nr:anthocyanidin 3-O-glucoside-6''-O-coumaroyltransferase 2-like [Hordeum vulgare]